MITGSCIIDKNISIQSGFSASDDYIYVLWKEFAISFIPVQEIKMKETFESMICKRCGREWTRIHKDNETIFANYCGCGTKVQRVIE